ncbi:MAG: hypothetical protein AAF539_09385 [Planctomycetota bacterium]
MQRISTLIWHLASGAVLLLSGGCLALGVPSERYHDPADRGGLFSDFQPSPETMGQPIPSHADALIATGAVLTPEMPGCVSCDMPPDTSPYPLEMDVTGSKHEEAPPEPPKVPWPKFHPVPTRPIL